MLFKKLAQALVGAGLATGSLALWAQGYPTKPVKLVVSFAAGGPTDVVARMVGEKLAGVWGQTVIVENRPGAGGTIGSALVAKSPADGYTLNLAANSHAYNDALIGNLSYDVIKDFTPISQVVSFSNILLVHPSVSAQNLGELVAFAKANPGKLAFASSGSATGSHIAAELFRRVAGIDILIVHFKGAAPATTDLLAGQLQAMFNNPVSSIPHVKGGKLRALASTGATRSTPLPSVPTVAESGYPGFKTDTWFGLMGPAGLPREIVSKVNRDVATVLAIDDLRQRLILQGLEPTASTPEQMLEAMRAENKSYGTLIRDADIKMN
ncbi:MAG: Bug family tripartite tricarboxylate transporter substrate binding protein [Burkholderiales bacterium]